MPYLQISDIPQDLGTVDSRVAVYVLFQGIISMAEDGGRCRPCHSSMSHDDPLHSPTGCVFCQVDAPDGSAALESRIFQLLSAFLGSATKGNDSAFREPGIYRIFFWKWEMGHIWNLPNWLWKHGDVILLWILAALSLITKDAREIATTKSSDALKIRGVIQEEHWCLFERLKILGIQLRSLMIQAARREILILTSGSAEIRIHHFSWPIEKYSACTGGKLKNTLNKRLKAGRRKPTKTPKNPRPFFFTQ